MNPSERRASTARGCRSTTPYVCYPRPQVRRRRRGAGGAPNRVRCRLPGTTSWCAMRRNGSGRVEASGEEQRVRTDRLPRSAGNGRGYARSSIARNSANTPASRPRSMTPWEPVPPQRLATNASPRRHRSAPGRHRGPRTGASPPAAARAVAAATPAPDDKPTFFREVIQAWYGVAQAFPFPVSRFRFPLRYVTRRSTPRPTPLPLPAAAARLQTRSAPAERSWLHALMSDYRN